MAELCLKQWVVIRLCSSEGQTLAAAVRCLATRYSTASALSRVPRAVGNSTCASPRGGSRNHAFKTAMVGLASMRTSLFLRPLSRSPDTRPFADESVGARKRHQLGEAKACLN